jgi:hypothetical protein
MKINLASDLHLEFGDNVTFPGGELLLLAGDILVARHLRFNSKNIPLRKRFFDVIDREFRKYDRVISIVGNHEHYQNIFSDTITDIRNSVGMFPFYELIENQVVDIKEGWKLFGATMWTDYNGGDYFNMTTAKRSMSDHHLILSREDTRFSPDDAYNQNKYSTDCLVRSLEENPDHDFIVMTHHTPSFKSCHPKYGGVDNPLNYAFSNTKLEKIINDYPRIKYWIHGHTHDSFDYMLGDCRVLCNPRGYEGHELNPTFDVNKFIEV